MPVRSPARRAGWAIAATLTFVFVACPATAVASTAIGPLASNGFASPWCGDPGLVSRLSAAAQDNCASSGISSSSVPIGNYGFDIHIDKGPLGLGGSFFASALQDLVLTNVWTALVWLVHALLVALEWCYSLDLLGGGPMATIARALQSEQAAFTDPWLVLALAVAGALLVYHGIIRRRVAESLGTAAVALAMVVAGLWVIADPAGTVGATSRLVNQASLGTLGAIDSGTPDHPERNFADAMGGVMRATVTAPWCYLEFGDVGWCSDPSRVDQRLRSAAARIAADDRNAAACGSGVLCVASSGGGDAALRDQADLIARAHTNGEFFLALPTDGPMRNSINDERSLLRVLCQTSDATACSGPTAAQAEFRTEAGTASRAGGLLFIAIGVVGMLVLLIFIGFRLLTAAFMSVVYLLVTPVAVIAPAFGDGGRAAFRTWSVRLLGAVVAKLVYSVLLGAVLLTLRVLLSLGVLGWWTEWLLMAAFWWVVFIHRHELLAHVIAEDKPSGGRARRPSLVGTAARIAGPQIVGHALDRFDRNAQDRKKRRQERQAAMRAATLRRPGTRIPAPHRPKRQAGPPSRRQSGAIPDAGPSTAVRGLEGQVETMIERRRAEASALAGNGGPGATARDSGAAKLDAQRRKRLAEQLELAEAAGDRRRVVSLRSRLLRVDGRIAESEQAVRDARSTLATFTVGVASGLLHDQVHRELDRQAALPRGVNRDYGSLTALVGVERAAYERMQAGDRRRVRLQIDRELESRHGWSATIANSGERLAWRTPGEGTVTSEQVEQLLGWSCRVPASFNKDGQPQQETR